MVGPKARGPEAYERWLEKHKIAEKKRKWKLQMEENPIPALPESERGELPMTNSLLEAYWHPVRCDCGSCLGDAALAVKAVRLEQRPTVMHITRSSGNPFPELPRQIQARLLAVSAEARSKAVDPHQ